MRLIDADKLKEYPIRLDHYDKENGSKAFVYGVESVLEYADYLPTVKAIPIEWLSEKHKQMDKVWKTSDTVDEAFQASDVLYAIELVKDLWEREND